VTEERPRADLAVDGDSVIVCGPGIEDRRARLFFRGVVGAELVGDCWRCPRRRTALADHVVRINNFLERSGYVVDRSGVANTAVERAIERVRSYGRARAAAIAWRNGLPAVDLDVVQDRLTEAGWPVARPLKAHQKEGLAHALSAVNAANFSVPGSGKTAVAIAVAATHLLAGTIENVIVVGPLSSFRPWETELSASGVTALRARRVRGSARVRLSIYAAAERGDVLLMSYATASADRVPLREMVGRRAAMLVVDESHRIKRFRGGAWAPALVDIAVGCRIRMILSGTPMPQGGRDLYTQLSVLWPNGELTGSKDAFATKVDSSFGSVVGDVLPFVSRTPKDRLGLPPIEIERHDAKLVGLQGEVYELVESGLRRRIAAAETWADKIEALKRARPLRLIQAATNPDLFNRRDDFYHLPRLTNPSPTLMDRLARYAEIETPAKSEAALQIVIDIANGGGKVVCWSNFVGNLDQFSALVRARLGLACFQIDGRVPTGDEPADDSIGPNRSVREEIDTREILIGRFLDTTGPAILVANPASCSESISLHSACHNAIYLDRTFDCAQYLQSIDRIHRLGLSPETQTTVHLLIATINGSPTVDSVVDAALLTKEARMRQLLEGAELRPLSESIDPVNDAEGNFDDLARLLEHLLGEGDDN
jgi:hypothetical protein